MQRPAESPSPRKAQPSPPTINYNAKPCGSELGLCRGRPGSVPGDVEAGIPPVDAAPAPAAAQQSTGAFSEQGLYDSLANSLAEGHATTLGSSWSASGPIVADHAYVVKSVETTAEGLFVTVYNPWGFDGRSWDGNYGDALLTLSISQVHACFSTACVSLA